MAEVGDSYRPRNRLLRHLPAVLQEHAFNPDISNYEVTSVQKGLWASSYCILRVIADTGISSGYIKCLQSPPPHRRTFSTAVSISEKKS
jgi:hypothetical protein